MEDSTQKWERFRGGSAEAERVSFDKLAKDIMRVQVKLKKKSSALRIDRTFHAKPILAVTNARFRVADNLPEDLQQGFMRPGAEYPATVRLSNASGVHQADKSRDLRGMAIRVAVSDDEIHDLLMTNFPVPHARDATQFVAFAKAMAGNRLVGVVRLMFAVGPGEAVRMFRNLLAGARRKVLSLGLESFWSRGAMLWGSAGPVRYFVRPERGAASAPPPPGDDPNYLSHEMAKRLAGDDVVYEFCIQRFVDETTTPVEDAAVEWPEGAAPPIEVATLVIPRQDLLSAEAAATAREVEQLNFNPWHTSDEFRPMGHINRARKAAYQASAAHRGGLRFHTDPPLRNRIATRATEALFKVINRRWEWHRLPLMLALLNLSVLRHELRRDNLIGTELPEAPPRADPTPPGAIPENVRTRRMFDGSYNDLSAPKMGAVGATFGRNIKPGYLPDLIDEPNPVTVSRTLLRREHFIPATTLNVLAAAWIQFQVHDWVQHKRHPLGKNDIRVPLPDGGKWQNVAGGPWETEMRIAGDEAHAEADPAAGRAAPVFTNMVSHWWDASEVYGTDEKLVRSLREGAKLRLDNGYLPLDANSAELAGFNQSWWLGLSALQTLFAREHNAICDALRSEYPYWNDERVFHTARLVVSALIAKIHTVEWTPAILATEIIDVGLKSNWYGAPEDPLTQFGLWLTDVHALKGIPETEPDHHTAPYALTEDFATVYRMHPLLPDDYRFYDRADGNFLEAGTFDDIQGTKTDEVLRRLELGNVIYSLGIAHPGAITLHNYPRALQNLERENGELIDMSVVDIMRERNRGIPRYNAFREGLHKPRIKRWEDITADPESVRQLRDVYKSIDHVDAMVGLMAENPPAGHGFSDTAFRIFILMATRRLQSDRFLNVDFRPEIYSPLGIAWVLENGMTSIILRNFPELASVVPRDQSAFAPWRALPSER